MAYTTRKVLGGVMIMAILLVAARRRLLVVILLMLNQSGDLDHKGRWQEEHMVFLAGGASD
jgi:NhaP-type Na+/H+ or K+/H+ antiporter